MCNSYRIKPKGNAVKGGAGRVSEAVEKLPSSLVRKSDPGIVVLAEERVAVMRWGFHRSFNPSINNARSDKLGAGIPGMGWGIMSVAGDHDNSAAAQEVIQRQRQRRSSRSGGGAGSM
jgi:hypothetical protein